MEDICNKRMQEDLNRWSGIPYSWIGILSVVEITIFPKLSNIVPIKIAAGTFVGIDELILKFMWKCK